MKKITTALLFLLLISNVALAQLRLPAIIGDHMVLQQQSNVDLWGWAGPAEELIITLDWDEKVPFKTKASNTGMWRALIKTPIAGGPFTITIKGKEELTIKDVMIGEVWICSGQSNMEWSVNNGAADAKADLPNANIPGIRFFHVNKSAADDPQVHGEGQWMICTPETMKGFSSVGYFFGKKLHSELKTSIGLINASWGGTPAEVWTPSEKVKSDPSLKSSADLLKERDGWPKQPGVAYNAMIRPIVPYSIAGAIWYQGESNTAAPDTYAKLMKTMIESWRSDFKKDFPFYYVQIAPYTYGRKFEGVLVRQQQSNLLAVPRTGMVIISDVVDDVKNIHPQFKKPVGDRLANYALGDLYKRPLLGYQSPVYKSMLIDKGKARISFMYGEIGLISHGGPPTQCTIAGADGKFYPAVAKIEGSTVLVSAKEVKVPAAVRFCWDNTSIPNLFNKEGLPVSCFRTDSWELDMGPETVK
ncbi:sialate O-acetylesterase [soil metagenome]